jgi:hypothetical protein
MTPDHAGCLVYENATDKYGRAHEVFSLMLERE